jgi:hypothetical protein
MSTLRKPTSFAGAVDHSRPGTVLVAAAYLDLDVIRGDQRILDEHALLAIEVER